MPCKVDSLQISSAFKTKAVAFFDMFDQLSFRRPAYECNPQSELVLCLREPCCW